MFSCYLATRRIGPDVRATPPPVISDARIDQLITSRKVQPTGLLSRLGKPKVHGAHERAELSLAGINGEAFVIWSRRLLRYPDNWTVGLRWVDAEGRVYRLLRANGPHPSLHRNVLEGEVFDPCYHVHRATERYQRAGLKIDTYAQPTEEFAGMEMALLWLLRETNITPSGQGMETLL